MADRRHQRDAVRAQLHLASDWLRHLLPHGVHPREIVIARTALRERERLQEHQRHSDELAQPSIVRLDKSLQDDFRRQVGAVGERDSRQQDECQQQNGGRELKHSRPPSVQPNVLFQRWLWPGHSSASALPRPCERPGHPTSVNFCRRPPPTVSPAYRLPRLSIAIIWRNVKSPAMWPGRPKPPRIAGLGTPGSG